MTTPGTFDEYLDALDPDVRAIFERIRAIVHDVVPDVEECLSYRMPTFRKKRVILHVGAFKQHIGLFPPVRGDAALMKAVAPYAGEKGNLRFPLDQPIPYPLVERIVRSRVNAR